MNYDGKFGTLAYCVVNDREKAGQPVIVNIHGAGSRGTELSLLYDGSLLQHAKGTADFPFKVYAPLCHEDTWFDLYGELCAFLDFIREREAGADIFLTGTSMGGAAELTVYEDAEHDVRSRVYSNPENYRWLLE